MRKRRDACREKSPGDGYQELRGGRIRPRRRWMDYTREDLRENQHIQKEVKDEMLRIKKRDVCREKSAGDG